MVAAVLGLRIADVLVAQDFSTRGMRAYRPAKHGQTPGWMPVIGEALLNKKVMNLLMVMARW